MKTLLLMRHAKSSWSDPDLADHERPLNARGRRDGPRMGRWLSDQGLTPDLVITSTAVRALETARNVSKAGGFAADLAEFSELYHADIADWTSVLQRLPNTVECVLGIGHNPGMEELVDSLHNGWERMPTAAIAWFELPINDWSEFTSCGNTTLRAVWRPKEIEE